MDKALTMIFTDITSRNYQVLWGTGAGKGTFIIERAKDGATSLRFTGIQAQEHFKQLKHAWNRNLNHFDDMCKREEYSI